MSEYLEISISKNKKYICVSIASKCDTIIFYNRFAFHFLLVIIEELQ